MLKENTCSNMLDSFLKVGLGKRLTHPYANEGSLKLEPLT